MTRERNYIIREFDRVPRPDEGENVMSVYYIIREFDRVPRPSRRSPAAQRYYIIREFDRVPRRLATGCENSSIISSGNLIGCQGHWDKAYASAHIISSGNLIGCQGSTVSR